MDEDYTPNSSSRELSRRTVLTGAAWSVPVVAVAMGAPVAAASIVAGKFVIETMSGGSWVDAQYYGMSIQLRNDDTDVRPAVVPAITSGVVTITMQMADVGDVIPVVIANSGGDSPSVPELPATDPTWTAGTAGSDGTTATYTINFAGSIAGQGLTHVTFGVLGPADGLHTSIPVTVTATGSPTDGTVSSRTVTLY